MQKNAVRTALLYLAATILCAVFGAVYEVFSHEVYSYYMIYAFLFPLIGGALPFFLLNYAVLQYSKSKAGAAQTQRPGNGRLQDQADQIHGQKESSIRRKLTVFYPGTVSRCLYHGGILALTLGSILTGILEIYGTTNPLTAVYWLAGAGLLITGIAGYFLSMGVAMRRKTVYETQQEALK